MFDWVGRLHDRIRRGWRLMKAAFRVLRSEKQLLVFPILSSLALVLVLVSFAAPLLMTEAFRAIVSHQEGPTLNKFAGNVVYYLLVFAFYLCNYFVIVFFNSALVACVFLHFKGEKPTVSDGFRAAFSRFPQILMWALVGATVGLALKIIADNSGKLGKFIVKVMGITWSIMTYFVVPVLVVEKAGPFEAIKRSAKVMRRTWGESVVANFGVGLIMLLLFLASWLVPFLICMMIGGWAILVGYGITLLLWLALSLVSSVLHTIIVAALYLYATKKRAPRGFREGTLADAFGRA
jgi:hypothetical protein